MTTERLVIEETEVQGVIERIPVGLLESLEDRLGAAIPELMDGAQLGRKGRAINYLLLASREPDGDEGELWARAGTMPMPDIRKAPEPAEDADGAGDPTGAPVDLAGASIERKRSA